MADRFVTDDGCNIAFDYRPVADRPTILLSPSLGTNMALFDGQCAAWGERYGLLRYDPRGHGQSDVPGESYSMDRLGRDAVALLDHLNVARAHVLGVSLGGMLGQWMGYRTPERCASLILANTSAYMGPPENWTARIDTVNANGMEAIADAVIERWFTAQYLMRGVVEIDVTRAALLATNPAGYAGCCAAIRDMDMRATAGLINVSTLVISGKYDPATPAAHARYLTSAISDARLVELDAAHLSNLEQPVAFNGAVTQFLGELA